MDIQISYKHYGGREASAFYGQLYNEFEYLTERRDSSIDYVTEMIQSTLTNSNMRLSAAYVEMDNPRGASNPMPFIIGFCISEMRRDEYIYIHWIVSRVFDPIIQNYELSRGRQPSGFSQQKYDSIRLSSVGLFRARLLEDQIAIHYRIARRGAMEKGFKLCSLIKAFVRHSRTGYLPDKPIHTKDVMVAHIDGRLTTVSYDTHNECLAMTRGLEWEAAHGRGLLELHPLEGFPLSREYQDVETNHNGELCTSDAYGNLYERRRA
jgi:hypothetical protein